jgi:translation elongation factor EF-G
MKRYKWIIGAVLILAFSVVLFAQTPEPGRMPRWDVLVSWIKTGTMTLTNKTIASPTITGTLELPSLTNTAAGGDKGINLAITQTTNALTGNLIGGAFVATNGTVTAPSGVIYSIEAKARAATSGNVGGATIGRLGGIYSSVDAKNKIATTMRAFEASLDGGAGGSSTEAVAFEANNNSSATQTASYAFSANGGTVSGHKVYTADIRGQNGETWSNATNNIWLANSNVSMLDDMTLTLGTTTTNAETKNTWLFDEATSGVGQFRMGDMSNPQILKVNPGATVAGSEIYINHALGAGNCADLLGSYSKITVTGDGDADVTIVGDASRAYVGLTGGANNSVASQAYGTQAWAKHGGTGAITAMSGLSAMMDVGAENFTASTINSGHFHIQGAGDITGQFDGVMIEAYPDVDLMDSGLAICVDGGADVAAGIRIAGAPACQMLLSSGAKVFTGTAANGDAVYAEVGAKDAVGSIYISTGNGYIYIQVANAGNAADWYKVTASDAD